MRACTHYCSVHTCRILTILVDAEVKKQISQASIKEPETTKTPTLERGTEKVLEKNTAEKKVTDRKAELTAEMMGE